MTELFASFSESESEWSSLSEGEETEVEVAVPICASLSLSTSPPTFSSEVMVSDSKKRVSANCLNLEAKFDLP